MGKHIGILNKVELVGNVWFSEIKPVTMEWEVDDTATQLDEFYKNIGCKLVEIVYIEIEGEPYTLYFDEEGKIKGPWHPTYPLRYKSGEIIDVVAGSVMVVKEDEYGNIYDLTEAEQKAIAKHLEDEMLVARGWIMAYLARRREA